LKGVASLAGARQLAGATPRRAWPLGSL